MKPTELDGAAIAGGQQLVLAAIAALPHRSDGVNDVTGRKPVPFGDLCIAGHAAMKLAAFRDEIRTSRAMNGAVDTAATEKGAVRSVDDRVNA